MNSDENTTCEKKCGGEAELEGTSINPLTFGRVLVFFPCLVGLFEAVVTNKSGNVK